jgi:opacity protein-like surface antigen
MAPIRITIALAAALAVSGGALLFAPAMAQNHGTPLTGIPCRVSWDETTTGGDTQTSQGDVELTQIAPDPSGGFVAIGNGHANVTYHSSLGCTVFGSPWSASYMVTVESDDGRTADVDVSSLDNSHSVTLMNCLLNGDPQFDVDAPGLPTVNVPLHEGATPYTEDRAGPNGRHAGDTGTVTLHYCTPDHPNGH